MRSVIIASRSSAARPPTPDARPAGAGTAAADTRPAADRGAAPARGVRDRRDRRPRDVGAATGRRITCGYLLALCLTAGAILGSLWLVSDSLRGQARQAAHVALAGGQHGLATEVAALAMAAAAARIAGQDPQAPRLALERRTADAAAAHAALLQGPAQETGALRALYHEGEAPLAQGMEAFLGLARALPAMLARDGAGGAEGPRLAAAVAHALQVAIRPGSPLSDGLRQAAALQAAAAEQTAAGALSRHSTIAALILLLLLAQSLLIFRPIARRVAALADRLDREANRDPLTGLLNRRALSEALGRAMAGGWPVALIIADLDWFKEANDAEGHAGGDALLCAAAGRIREVVRPGDAVGRHGGDEFAVVVLGPDAVRAAPRIAERIRAALEQPVPHAGRLLRLGATLGVALAPQDATTPEMLLRAADEALLRAKRAGRGRVGCASPADSARLSRDAAILRALDAGGSGGAFPGLAAALQPIMALGPNGNPGGDAAGRVHAFEALARWTHPELGALRPAEFLALAHRGGRIWPLARQVRASALATLRLLRAQGLPAPRVALNLSAAEIMRGDIAGAIEAEVAAAGLALADVEIEITEEVLLERVSDRTLDQLAALRGRGARLALDDFGTGTSGLAQLLRLPLDTVKLDSTFVRGLGRDGRAEAIVRATLSLADGLGMEVVAEGVETEAQAALLRGLGCHAAQGFLFARPMAADALEAWLRAREASAPLQAPAKVLPLPRLAAVAGAAP